MTYLFRLVFQLAASYLLAVFALSFIYLIIAPVSTVMMISAVRGDGMARQWVKLEGISPNLVRAVIAAEDARFCQHQGIDWQAMDEVVAQAKRGQSTRGASTISMQVAKNLFLWNGRSWLRKGLEAPIALWIDFLWPKRRIVEVYLNIAEWGHGRFGIEQAARHEFGLGASQLNVAQAALLATMLPDPIDRSAGNPGPAQRTMAASVQRRLFHADRSCLR